MENEIPAALVGAQLRDQSIVPCLQSGVPEAVSFQTKPQIAADLIAKALADGVNTAPTLAWVPSQLDHVGHRLPVRGGGFSAL